MDARSVSLAQRKLVVMMAKELKIPEGVRGAYNNLMRRIPFEYRNDPNIAKTMLVYLKLGGKKLAEKKLESLKKPFSKEFVIRKMQMRNEILREGPNPEGGEMAVADTQELDSPDSDDDID